MCEAELGPLTLLVGRNGSGKSNFLDALRFVADGLNLSLDHAIKARGGIEAVRRRSTGHPHNFGIDLQLQLTTEEFATYGFEIAAQPSGGLKVKEERLAIHRGGGQVTAGFQIIDGQLQSRREPGHPLLAGGNGNPATHEGMPPVLPDRLYLVYAAGLPQYRRIYDGLLAMGFYNLNPEAMKELQAPDAGELLRRDGSNIASVVARLAKDRPEIIERIKGYLRSIVPDITDFDRVQLGPRETLEFRQLVEGSKHPWKFFAASMSDGTLRALGALVAVQQLTDKSSPARLIGIEEPEAALHPAATGALMDSLREAATQTQVLVTTHSPDLLDRVDPDSEQLLVLQAIHGRTDVAPVDPASRETIRNHLYSAGELLRIDQLEPDRADVLRQSQLPLFAETEAAS
ncbi:MAG: AAA family ATPase [Planctomycetaceae bacterium]|nr:AAA family ATPase [Planctomycetaceae bacterium]